MKTCPKEFWCKGRTAAAVRWEVQGAIQHYNRALLYFSGLLYHPEVPLQVHRHLPHNKVC
jgi:hypothetical protein